MTRGFQSATPPPMASSRIMLKGHRMADHITIDTANLDALFAPFDTTNRHGAVALRGVPAYVDTLTLLRNNMKNILYCHRNGNYQPRVSDPWKESQ